MATQEKDSVRGFRIAEAAHLSGFSQQGLRFLEDKNVVAPARTGNGGYRTYDLWQTGNILYGKMLRTYGFSLEDAASLAKSATLDSVVAQLIEQQSALARDIAHKKAVLAVLSKRAANMQTVSSRIDRVHESTIPGYWRIDYASGDNFTHDPHTIDLLARWAACFPFVQPLLYIVQEENGWSALRSAFVIFEDDLEGIELDLPLDDKRVVHRPAARAISTIDRTMNTKVDGLAAAHANMEGFSSLCPHFEQYLKEHELRPAGDSIFLPLASTHEDNVAHRYYCNWLPVEPLRAAATTADAK